ncbi:uncharacterized protein LOC141902080 [Tubulanus polymorphus]|uniref:uncharacterized protein LOC141902080 n=1 Tax=Tubulanus polymorphus TaxID=672921 RepID=UPI003DA3BFB5
MSCWASLVVCVLLMQYDIIISHETTSEEIYPQRLHSIRHDRDLSTLDEDMNDHEHEASFALAAFSKRIIIDLIKNKILIPAEFTTRTFGNDGSVRTTKHRERNCHYQGRVRGDPESSVVISTCENGLRGFIETEGQKFYLEPVNDQSLHVIRRATEKDDVTASCAQHGEQTLKRRSVTHHISKRNVADIDNQYRPYLTTDETRYSELVFVVDHALYNHYNGNVSKIKERVFILANAVDAIYVRINIRIILVGVEIWNASDLMTRHSTGGAELSSFKNYVHDHLWSNMKFDNAQFLSLNAWSDAAGMAYVGTICGKSTSTGVNSWDKSSIIGPYVVVAHEMGHNFGFNHDSGSCTCLTARGCIMGGHKTRLPGFSNCSLIALSNTNDKCLYNLPTQTMNPVCGNAVREGNEECDCGSAENCDTLDPCCDRFTCRLKAHTQCSNLDGCCNNCLFSRHGTLCRPGETSCDEPEFCTGESATCPENRYKPNGFPCNSSIQIFEANTNYYSIVNVKLNPKIEVKAIRIHPLTFNLNVAMRLEFHGCSENEITSQTPTPLQSNNKFCLVPEVATCDVASIENSRIFYREGSKCDEEHMKFTISDTGVIKHHCSGLNVCPEHRNNSANIIVSSSCTDEMSMFVRTDILNIKHVLSGRCIHANYGYPRENAYMVLWNDCSKDIHAFNFMEQDCTYPLGMEDGRILDSQITASSYWSDQFKPSKARLRGDSSWQSKQASSNANQWIEVDFGQLTALSAISVQGRGTWYNWVETFYIEYTTNGLHWTLFAESGLEDSTSYCFDGKCPKPRSNQCQEIWGPKAQDGAKSCYDEFNMGSDGKGTCEAGRNTSCSEENVLCGQLQCNAPYPKPNIDIGWTYGDQTVDEEHCSTAVLKHNDSIGTGMVVEGTKCGPNKMCIQNECQSFVLNEPNTTNGPVDGGWGTWSDWTNCNRSCDGGTHSRHRFCNNPVAKHGGADCVGEQKQTEPCNQQACPLAFSCRDLQFIGESTGVQYMDGVYNIRPRESEVPIKTYCDMSRDGGGWTLLVSSHTNAWTNNTILSVNVQQPRLNHDYSILGYADDIKNNANVTGAYFEYRLEAQTLGRWGGIWQAPRDYTFLSKNNQQIKVRLIRKFDDWNYGDDSIEERMPWISGARLTTSTNSRNNWWGTITGDAASYHPAPWISGHLMERDPEYIWYWLRESTEKSRIPKSCQELKLLRLNSITPLVEDGIYEIKPDGLPKIAAQCKMTSYGGGWTLIYARNDGVETGFNQSFASILANTVLAHASKVQYLITNGDDEIGKPVEIQSNQLDTIFQSLPSSTSKTVKVFIRESISHRSCNDIKNHAAHSGNFVDGFYMIKSADGFHRAVYCDMESEEGAYTLLVTSRHNNWTREQVLRRNIDTPSLVNDYSILFLADEIKAISNDSDSFKYKIEARQRRHWGGVWVAPKAYSFASHSGDQTNVHIIEKFDSWEYSWWNSINMRMPYVASDGNKALLTTSLSPDYYWSGTIISGNTEYDPAWWISSTEEARNPGFIWYWINEG